MREVRGECQAAACELSSALRPWIYLKLDKRSCCFYSYKLFAGKLSLRVNAVLRIQSLFLYEMKREGCWADGGNGFLQAFFGSSGKIPYFTFDAVSIDRNNCFLQWQPLSAVTICPDPFLNLLEALFSFQVQPPPKKRKPKTNKTKFERWNAESKGGKTYSGTQGGVAVLAICAVKLLQWCGSIREEIDCVKANHYCGCLSFVMTICVSPHPISVHAPKWCQEMSPEADCTLPVRAIGRTASVSSSH